MSEAKKLTPKDIANQLMADEAWQGTLYVRAEDYDSMLAETERLQVENAQVREQLRLANVDAALEEAEANTVREACNQRAFRLEAEIERLRDELRQSSIDHTRAEVERLREALRAETARCSTICEEFAQRCRDAGWDSEAAILRDAAKTMRE